MALSAAGRIAPRWSVRGGRRILVAMSAAGLALGVVPGPSIAAGSDGGAVTQRLWSALLTKCGESYFYSGSVFDGSGMLSDMQQGHQGTVEFKGVRFNSVPIRVTDAERANGLAYHARVTMIAHLYREQGGDWQDGPDLRPRNTDDIIAKALGSANSDMFDMGGNGSMALEILKVKGTWAVTRSSTTLSGPLRYDSKYYDVDKLVAAKVPRYDCKAGGVLQPTLTPADKRAAIIQRAVAAGQTRGQAAAAAAASEKWERDQIVLRDPEKGIPFVRVTPEQLDALRSYYDDRGFSKYIKVTLDDGSAQLAEFHAFQILIARFPDSLSQGDWLAPGTRYQPVCKVGQTAVCTNTYDSNSLRFANKQFVIVKVTSGAHAGEFALIDQGNYSPTVAMVCPAQPTTLRC